ncbi:hypothetical protein BD324DRAFT_623701 [Kockovaella imperatae]|uniref:SAGA-associated factor 11 n=1 Tax=Kockovaella imperatae TaxID=4999 RepID=A0A1Y1UK35_9TREE|nr:hypothetical protein BD324DRAFT_623701 [Kockovaella imperatae]ORX37897.1 hypothetical protein BD324DRAFT_623701 [Kockovaella imperatae]
MASGQGKDRPEIQAAAKSILQDMMDDLILTVAISAHREIKRSKVPCGVCHTHCRGHSALSSAHFGSSSSAGPSTSRAPGGAYAVGPEKGTGGNTGIGSGSGKPDGNGNVFFDCLVCGRGIASSRYAPHLSSCLGMNGGTRRKAARAAINKNRLGANDRSSPSPYYQASDNGDSDTESTATASKKSKKINGNGKRARSPGSVPRSKASSGISTPNTVPPRTALPPSKLGRPPTSRETLDLTSPDRQPIGPGRPGAKTLPGASADMPVVIDGMDVDKGDDTSDDADDY